VSSADISGPDELSKKYTCTAIITVKPKGSSNNVEDAVVFISWEAPGNRPLFPYNTTAVTATNGVATSVSRKLKSVDQGCSFTVRRVVAAGYLPLNMDTPITRTSVAP
jgi:hypothetical protein